MTRKHRHKAKQIGGGIELSGPGLVRAVNESVKSRKILEFVYDYIPITKSFRIGYFLENTPNQKAEDAKINWFSPEEISIVGTNEIKPDDPTGQLTVSYIGSREKQRNFIVSIPVGEHTSILIRCLYRLQRNALSDFVIQVESHSTIFGRIENRPIIRYDCAHQFIHRDMISIKGVKNKEALPTRNPIDAVGLAISEIQENLPKWLNELGYTDLKIELFEKKVVQEEILLAKQSLLSFIKNPESFIEEQNSRISLFNLSS